MSDNPQRPDQPPLDPEWRPRVYPSQPEWETLEQPDSWPEETVDEDLPRYGGFWIRLGAWVIDLVILFLLFGTLVGIPVAICYMPVMWWKRGATLGQKVLGLRVVRAIDGEPVTAWAATQRFLVMIPESLFAFGWLGFAWAAFDDRKQAWHDKVARTIVIRAELAASRDG